VNCVVPSILIAIVETNGQLSSIKKRRRRRRRRRRKGSPLFISHCLSASVLFIFLALSLNPY